MHNPLSTIDFRWIFGRHCLQYQWQHNSYMPQYVTSLLTFVGQDSTLFESNQLTSSNFWIRSTHCPACFPKNWIDSSHNSSGFPGKGSELTHDPNKKTYDSELTQDSIPICTHASNSFNVASNNTLKAQSIWMAIYSIRKMFYSTQDLKRLGKLLIRANSWLKRVAMWFESTHESTLRRTQICKVVSGSKHRYPWSQDQT